MSKTAIQPPHCNTAQPGNTAKSGNTSKSDDTSLVGLTRRSFLVGAAGLALTAAFGCGRSRSTGTAAAPSSGGQAFPTVIVAAFDISSSTDVAAIRRRYLADFQTVLSRMGDGGVFVAGYVITANTEATSMDRISQPFPDYQPWRDNPDEYKVNRARSKAQAVVQANRLLTSLQTARATDLLNAFHDAANVFNGEDCKGAAEKRLVICSDMIEQAGADDFLQEDLTEPRIQQIIAAQRAAGQLPELHGVKVWVAGATADPEGRVGPEKIGQIRRFWIEFFRACGGDLATERYSTALTNFPAVS